ncbi:MAG: UbiA family prenyltransferase [Desulfobacterales bacterium]
MPETAMDSHVNGLSRLKLYFALSRTPHGLLDMCTPAFGALLWLGHFPTLGVILLGLITTFAGYTAVYALNDVIDFEADKEKAATDGFVRHPMAQGLMSFKQGLIWTLAWGSVALIGAYILNPVCVLIFLAGCSLEAIYCMLWRVSPFRTIVSGAVKTSGAIAAVFAVDPSPSWVYVGLLFLNLFFWEIGGQNIPNDWVDLNEDKRFKAQTIPVCFGLQASRQMVLGALVLAICLNGLVFYFSQMDYIAFCVAISLVVGIYLLLMPALRLYRTLQAADAMSLFNRASYYPPALFVIVLFALMI